MEMHYATDVRDPTSGRAETAELSGGIEGNQRGGDDAKHALNAAVLASGALAPVSDKTSKPTGAATQQRATHHAVHHPMQTPPASVWRF